jgi:TonB family protein
MQAAVIALALCGALAIGQGATKTQLVPERGPNFTLTDDVFEIRSGQGWLRTSRLFLDFVVAFEFKAATPESDAGVLVRTWPGMDGWPGRGYRFRLPTDATVEASSLFVGHRQVVTVIDQKPFNLRSADEWQEVRIIGHGKQVSVAVNGRPAGVFALESYGGYILFDNKKGRVQLRNLTIASMETVVERPAALMTFKQLKDAGGQIPKLVHEVKPKYTPEAMKDRVRGIVLLEMTVLPDGSTGAAKLTRSLHPDLDLSAIAAVRAWQFTPASLKGEAVPVLVEVEMSFKLK